ncbi:MAG: class I SAM-dependent methyltransferase [Magnetospirillum sp.]|nr:class I SAM-dependent methyltransferase [Magnetospirillum sp.]
MDRQAHWQGVYASKDETSVSWFQERPATSLALLECAKPGARIVDVGGGASRLVDHLLERGYDVTVLDIAGAALEKAKARLGEAAAKVRWVTADITRWKSPAPMDVWHDRAVFHFLTEEGDRRAYADAMAAALPSGGHAVIGTFAADGPERCSGLPVCRYDAKGLAAQFAASFRLVDELAEEHRTPGGNVQRFQFIVLRRL